jgi:hypothetical protein
LSIVRGHFDLRSPYKIRWIGKYRAAKSCTGGNKILGSSIDTRLLVGHNRTKIQKNVWEIRELSNRKYREAKSCIGGKNIPTLGLSTDTLLGYDHAKIQKQRMENLAIFESPFLRKLSTPENF